LPCENAVQVSCQRRDLKRGFIFSHRPAVRLQTPLVRSRAAREKLSRGQRVLNGVSGAGAGGRVPKSGGPTSGGPTSGVPTASNTASLEKWICSTIALIP